MTISFKARVPKVTEDDILFNTTIDPLSCLWVWRVKAIRADDIVDIVSIAKDMCYVTHYDHLSLEGGYKKTVIKETIEDAILKWEISLATSATFKEDDDEYPEESNGQPGADDDEEDEGD